MLSFKTTIIFIKEAHKRMFPLSCVRAFRTSAAFFRFAIFCPTYFFTTASSERFRMVARFSGPIFIAVRSATLSEKKKSFIIGPHLIELMVVLLHKNSMILGSIPSAAGYLGVPSGYFAFENRWQACPVTLIFASFSAPIALVANNPTNKLSVSARLFSSSSSATVTGIPSSSVKCA